LVTGLMLLGNRFDGYRLNEPVFYWLSVQVLWDLLFSLKFFNKFKTRKSLMALLRVYNIMLRIKR